MKSLRFSKLTATHGVKAAALHAGPCVVVPFTAKYGMSLQNVHSLICIGKVSHHLVAERFRAQRIKMPRGFLSCAVSLSLKMVIKDDIISNFTRQLFHQRDSGPRNFPMTTSVTLSGFVKHRLPTAGLPSTRAWLRLNCRQ